MKVPAPTAVRNLPDQERQYLRFVFGRIIGTGFCPPNLGLEATHETLEYMYDTGEIKLTFEPWAGPEGVTLGRMMLFVPGLNAYQVIEGLKLECVKGLI